MDRDEPVLKALINDEAGATAVEYGLIVVLISIAAVIAFKQLGLNLAHTFTTIENALRI